MEITNYTEARKSLKALMQKVYDDSTPIIITRQGGEPVVMMSLEQYRGYDETEYLMRSPKNKEVLLESIHNIREGNCEFHELIEDDDTTNS